MDVWICESARGHLPATGRDAPGRKQYRCHARWRNVRDRDKFARVVEFAERLPQLRRRLQHDSKSVGLGRDIVVERGSAHRARRQFEDEIRSAALAWFVAKTAVHRIGELFGDR